MQQYDWGAGGVGGGGEEDVHWACRVPDGLRPSARVFSHSALHVPLREDCTILAAQRTASSLH